MDVPDVLPKPSGQMNLVLEEDSCDMVPREAGWVVRIVPLHQEVILEGCGCQGQDGGTQLGHLFVSQHLSPHQ